MPIDEEGEDADDGSSAEISIYSETDRRLIGDLLKGAGSWREPAHATRFGSLSWRPFLVASDRAVCHLSLVGEIRSVWSDRMAAAANLGYVIHLAAPDDCWTENTVTAAMVIGAHPIVLKKSSRGWSSHDYESVARLVAKVPRVLPPTLLKQLADIAFERALKAKDAHGRGRTFEDLLILVLSQSKSFKIESFNFKNATEEIDIVLRDTRVENRPAATLVVVSAKNVNKPLGTDALDELESKMRNRGPRCVLGFLCVSRKFASSVGKHILRMSRDERVIVLIDGAGLRRLYEHADGLDVALNEAILAAEMR